MSALSRGLAMALLVLGLAGGAGAGETPSGAPVLAILAAHSFEDGDLETASRLGRAILALRRKQTPQAVEEIVENLGFLAAVATRRGDLAAAEDLLIEAQEQIEARGSISPVSASIQAHFGDFHLARGDLPSAASSYRSALSIRQNLPGGREAIAAELLRKLARVEISQGNLPAAEQLLDQASALAQERHGSAFHDAGLPLSLRDLTTLATKVGATQPKRSRRGLSGILCLDPDRTVLRLKDLATKYLTRWEPSDLELSPSLAPPGRSFLHERTALLSGDLTAVGELLENAAFHNEEEIKSAAPWWGTRARNLCRAVDLLEQQRSRVGGILEPRAMFEVSMAAYHRVCLKAFLRLGRRDEAFHALERGRARSFLRLLKAEAEPLDLDRALAALDPGTLLLSYYVGEAKTSLFILAPGGGREFSVLTLPMGKRTLREEIGAFRNLLHNGRTEVQALDVRARRLYGLLLRPAEKHIAGAERLLILPDGPLHTLPFAALRRKEQYLVEWKPIHSVVSATVYAEIRKARSEARDPGALRLVAFGDPLYPATRESLAAPEVRDAVRGRDFPPLPATRREVEGIASLFPQAEVYLGAEATEERVKQAGPRAHLLHFACHGFLNDRFPLNSGLALTLPDPPAEGQDNGLLQAWEIFEGVRLDADLVTLSACNTALGPEMGGEGLVGLTRAFQYAGARSVLASLWSVSDASTGELMKRFYTHLRAGKTKDEALRAAQTELIHKNDALSHPYHWAAFQLFGDWR